MHARGSEADKRADSRPVYEFIHSFGSLFHRRFWSLRKESFF